MEAKNLRLSWQVLLVLAFFSCFAVGLKTFLTGIGSTLNVPQMWDLNLSGSIALMIAGTGLSSLLLGYGPVARSSGAILAGYGAASLLAHIHSWLTASPSIPITSFWLPVLPTVLVMAIGLACWKGLKSDTGKWWLFTAGMSILLGMTALLGHLGGAELSPLVARLTQQMSVTASVFAVFLGGTFLILAKYRYPNATALDGITIIIAAAGVMVTLVLVYIASVDQYAERQSSGEELLTNLALTIEQSTKHRSITLQRMVNRWSYLEGTVDDSFYQREVKQLIEERPSLRGFLLIDPERNSNWRYASSPTLLFWMEDQLVGADVLRWIRNLRQGDITRSWFFPDEAEPNRALVGVRPQDDRNFVLIVVMDLDVLLTEEVRKDPADFNVEVVRNGSLVTRIESSHRNNRSASNVSEMAQHNASLPGNAGDLTLKAFAHALPVRKEFQSFLPLAILVFGLFLTYQLMVSRTLMAIKVRQAKQLHLSEQRFRSLFDQNPVAVLCFDGSGLLLFMNPTCRSKMDLGSEKTEKVYFHQIFNSDTVPVEQLRAVYDAYEHARAGNVKTDFLLGLKNAGGERKKFEASFLPVMLEGGLDGVFCVARDVTERLRVQERQRLMERSLEASENAVIITDARLPGYPVIYVNPAFIRMTGFSGEEVRNQTLDIMIGNDTAPDDIEAVKSAVFAEKSATMTIRSYRKDGTPFWNQLFISPVRDDTDSVTHFIAVMNDISEKREHDQELAYQATHDVLTGLGNRSLFNDRLAHDFELAKRNNRLMAVLFIDLDDFKPINDAMGHKTGDKLLISVAERLSGITRASDTLARFGGDEFVLLLPELATPQEAEDIAQRILEEVARPHMIGANELHISASVGISLIDDVVVHAEKLLQQADMAMYKAKQQGKDAYEMYSCDLDEHLSKRVNLRNDLQDAINRDQLFLEYQPVVNSSGEVCGLEALVRWRHPEKGSISPAEFIPLAEETGQIIQIGRWVLQQACRDAKRLVRNGLLLGRMAVNLSPMQFHRPNFLASLRQVLEEEDLSAAYLELELTEGILMKNTDGAIDILNALSGMGVSTAIDDFGTGFSSFSYLRELPVSKVKIDKSFVDDITISAKDASVCKGIISLARELDLSVVAEGVETEEQFKYLRGNGCEIFQGYLFAKPMQFEQLSLWLARAVSITD